MLKKEWDEHQKVMNQFVPFENMVFQIDYCDEENRKNYVAQKKAAEAALAAEKDEKAKKLAEELAKAGDENAKKVKAAAIEKNHKEKLEKRVEFLLKWIQGAPWLAVDNWLVVKPKFERAKRSMEISKAGRLGENIKKRDELDRPIAAMKLV
ncbi:hypothetical protein ACN38_g1100 [Penicillium nordicum]|uniref:Uncharacterized protein n=1 Tax=Penicillium nordicum TaxID=229535 RepID=A0A0M8PG21_9EURO|nr:hypothetical protein ACN38_g1100 [Penicillium nordicum]